MKKKKKLRIKPMFLVIVSLVLIIAGIATYFMFFNDKDSTTKKSNTNKSTEEVKVVETKKLNIINEDSNTRSIAVMINNHAQARPYHSGLQSAYIVYEMIVEGGFTRYMAVFKDQTTAKIGSVRSSRHYFLDYAMENDAIYVHFGWSPQAQADISTYKINNINGLTDSGFWRDKSLRVSSEHTAYTSIENINAAIAKKGYRATTTKDTLLNYSVDGINLSTLEGAVAANNISIPYSSSVVTSYVYDSTNQVYLRFINNVAHTDYVTKAQYTAKNIITYKVVNTSIDTYGRQTLSNITTGTGYYITNGYAVPITWTKSSRDSQTIYKYANGKEIDVNDGNTFIQIQPTAQTLTITQ